MIDIMMFLLVFFVVISLKMIAGTGIALEIPGSKTTQELKSSTVTIGVTKTGDTVVDGKTLAPDALKERLLALKKDKPVEVVLAGDKDVLAAALHEGHGHGARRRHLDGRHRRQGREEVNRSLTRPR